MKWPSVVVVGVVCGLLAAPPAWAAPPANDAFEHARALITGTPASGTNLEATAQEGEPVHSTWVAANRSVWFTWTAPETGLARVSACGSSFDTVVAVYGGSALAGIYATRIANNDSGCGSFPGASLVFLRVAAGTTYRVVLDGWTASDAGDYELVAEMAGDPGPPPANDDVDAAAEIAGDEITATGANAGATSGWNEWPAQATQLVWWRWVSTVDGQVRVGTCGSGFDTVLGVMRRSEGEWAGGNIARDGCGDRGMVTVDAVKGREYWIGVGGDAGASGPIELRLDATPDVTAPATTITAGPPATWGRRVARLEWTVDDETATSSECRLDDGAWYECVGGESLEGLAEGEHVFRVRSTDRYGNAEDPGAERRFTVTIPEAPNDDFAAATALAPGQPVSVNNGKAGAEPGEPAHDGWYYAHGLGANWSVWFTFTPAADDVAELDWCASGFDVTVAVYTGAAVGALTRLAQREEGCREALHVQGGVTYRLAIDGFARNLDYGTGPITIVLGYRGPAPDADPGPPPPDTTIATGSHPPAATTPPPTTFAPVTTDPILRLDRRRGLKARVDRRGRFSLPGGRVRCLGGPRCLIRVKVFARGARLLGAVTQPVRRGRERPVRGRLSRPGRALLVRRGRLTVRIRIRLAPGRTRTARLTLVAPRRG